MTTKTTMSLADELRWRGFVNQTTFPSLSVLDEKKLRFYMGFDASADSQQAGNLAALMFAKTFLRHGHFGYLLAGGSTSLIGDPGGKDAERPLQDEKTIAHNTKNAGEQIKTVMKGHKFELVNNLDWTKDVKILPFLRDIGKHFSMTPLIQRDYIATRLGENGAGISYTEFSYTILQGFDYLHLFDTYGVTLQLGGSDQWGNCLSGVELIRKARGKEAHVMTLNLVINKATGKKFGKSEGGAIWLDSNKTSAYQFYQFWLNADDEGVEGYLKTFTELDKPEVDAVMKEFHTNKSGRAAQRLLAHEVTKLVHGAENTKKVERATDVLFGSADFLKLTAAEKMVLAEELPLVKVGESFARTIVDAGLAKSNTEANRFMDSGAISLNGQKISMEAAVKPPYTTGKNLLKKGKNSFAVVEV
jgi:tyrosyl-tRNA synthetase